MTRPLIVAHRGASACAPENSLAAFRRAIQDGAEGIEFDVRLASDGVPVVFHDETLERIAGQRKKVSAVVSSQLAEIDIGSWFNKAFPQLQDPSFSSERIPTLAQTLKLLDDFSGRVYIELKCDGSDAKELVRATARILKDSPLLPQIIVKSFSLSVLPIVREFLPTIKTAALFEPSIMTMLRKKRFIIDLAEEFGADELSLHRSLISRGLMKRAKERALSIAAWTIDKPAWIPRGTKLGLRALITNNPKMMLDSIRTSSSA